MAGRTKRIPGWFTNIIFLAVLGLAVAGWFRYQDSQRFHPEWSVPAGAQRAIVQYHDDGFITTSVDPSSMLAVSPGGEVLWEYTSGSKLRNHIQTAAGKVIYHGGWDGVLRAVDGSGAEVWSLPLAPDSDLLQVWLCDSLVFAANGSGTIHAVTMEGVALWSFDSGQYIMVPPAVDAATGRVYIASAAAPGLPRYLFCLDPSGELLWQVDTVVGPGCAPLVASSGNLLLPTAGRGLQAYDQSGQLLWTAIPQKHIYGTPVEDAAGTVFFGSADGWFHAVDQSGTVTWSCDLKHAGDVDLRIHGAAALNGERLWVGAGVQEPMRSRPFSWLLPPPDFSKLVRGPGRLYALDTTTGAVIWEFQSKWSLDGTPAVGPDGTVYVCSWEPRLLAIRPPL